MQEHPMDTPAWFVLLPSAPNPQYFKSGRFNGLCQFFITEWTLKGDSCRAVFQTNLCSNTIQCIQCRRYTAAAVFTAHPADLYGQAANGSGELFDPDARLLFRSAAGLFARESPDQRPYAPTNDQNRQCDPDSLHLISPFPSRLRKQHCFSAHCTHGIFCSSRRNRRT